MENQLIFLNQLSVELDGITILNASDFSIHRHKVYLITGADENHNVILLKAIAGLLPYRHIQGKVEFEGINIYDATKNELDKIRKKTAFVFSDGTFISNLTVEENLLLPMEYHFPGYDRHAVLERLNTHFNFFNIPDVLAERPATLPYYTKKKISFIRAALMEPELILLDKPLFNLNTPAQEQVITFLMELKKSGTTFVLVSHCPHQLQEFIDETITLKEKQLVSGLSGMDDCMEGWNK